MDDADCHCYAVRRLNPFEGVLEVVELANARAYSPNGRVWQLQVLGQRPDHIWRSGSDMAPVEQFFNFGLWDADAGLHRVPANPAMDIGAMQAAAEDLAARLGQVEKRLPLPLIDRYEYWSIDADGRPVALLAATEQPERMFAMHVPAWRATRTGGHGAGEPARPAHAASLEAQVRRRGARGGWYERQDDGSGTRVGPGDVPDRLGADAFPELGLARDWPERAQRQRADDYLAWCAPRLLLLQRIGNDCRAWLEREACRQATELAAGYRLLPAIIDRERIDAARVEARLRGGCA